MGQRGTGRGRAAVVIVGAGGHGKVVCDALIAFGHRIAGWIDADPTLRRQTVCGFPVLGTVEELPQLLRQFGRRRLGFVVAVGDNVSRGTLFDAFLAKGLTPINAIHPKTVIARSVELGRGVVILAGAVINPESVIGDNVIINTAASVDHDNTIERDVHLSPGVHTGGRVYVERGVHVGLGAVVLPDRRIGAYSVVGAGAVVDRDLPPRVVAVGVPARTVRAVT